jgi:ABC-2 type transport system ATP-binding protein
VLLASAADRDTALAALGDDAHPVGDVRIHVGIDGHNALTRVSQVARALDDSSLTVRDLGLRRPTLDDVFLQLTGSAPPADPDASATPRPNGDGT